MAIKNILNRIVCGLCPMLELMSRPYVNRFPTAVTSPPTTLCASRYFGKSSHSVREKVGKVFCNSSRPHGNI